MVEGYRAAGQHRGASATTSASKCTTSAVCRPRPSSPAASSRSSRRCRIEEEHLGIRLEDMILITDNGVEVLSGSLPIAVAEIEQVMKR